MTVVGKGQSINNSLGSETVKLKQVPAPAEEFVHVMQPSPSIMWQTSSGWETGSGSRNLKYL